MKVVFDKKGFNAAVIVLFWISLLPTLFESLNIGTALTLQISVYAEHTVCLFIIPGTLRVIELVV